MKRHNVNTLFSMSMVLTIVFFLISLASLFYTIPAGIRYDVNVGGHLKRAADANTIDIAEQEIQAALTAIEANGWTTGNTSVFWDTPANDVAFWYNNLKTSLQELKSLPKDVQPFERSNMLMKLRETVLDHTNHGDTVTAPKGISFHPYNTQVTIWQASFLVAVFFFIIAAITSKIEL